MKDMVVSRFLELIKPVNGNLRDLYLFGSRCRNDWRPDSDYDILVLLDHKDRKIIDALYDAVMDILFETGRLISLKIFTVSEFNRLKSIPTPFISRGMKEGIKIGSFNTGTH
jgi:uncharacterized protein